MLARACGPCALLVVGVLGITEAVLLTTVVVAAEGRLSLETSVEGVAITEEAPGLPSGPTAAGGSATGVWVVGVCAVGVCDAGD